MIDKRLAIYRVQKIFTAYSYLYIYSYAKEYKVYMIVNKK